MGVCSALVVGGFGGSVERDLVRISWEVGGGWPDKR